MFLTIGQLLVSGVAFGAIYALIATAFSLIYRTTRTINFAQGHFAIVGGYVTLWALATVKLPYLMAAMLGILAVVALSVLVEVLAFRPLYRLGPIPVIVSSIALTFVLETLMQLGWGAQSIRLPSAVSGTFIVADIVITWQQLLVILALVVSIIVLHFLMISRLGRAMRATAESRDVASLVGIKARPMITLSFALAGILTGIAGVLVAPLTYLEPGSGGHIGLLGVVAAIVGRLGNLNGALIGGFAIGIANIASAYILGGGLVETMTFWSSS